MAIVGCILAGGQARRMGGGDKGLLTIAGQSILSRVIDRLTSQVDAVILNANGDRCRFEAFALPVVADPVPGFAGPLAGVLAGLEWAGHHRPEARLIVTVAADTPFFPADLVVRLVEAVEREDAEIGVAQSGGRRHPVFALWPLAIAASLRRALVEEDIRKVDRFTARYRVAAAVFDDHPVDPFFNVNAPEDLMTAEQIGAGAEG